ncbi:response regulator transcription factor [Paraburkholderia kirstenboschensis]|uniref:Response regulator transcription factor n=1 Tax=Paraburkholderia kirstenboschensis TaxID=1245436 RepID=A0ABZ0EBD1_9BURK|nr:response regulator transcription factor [Paraburkholderia kirstenboschensis]WOD13836.1 response regulator transcription factor [Paraburkholderia kirstenboschensis]
MRILLAESVQRDARRLSSILRAQGYAVDRVKDDREAQLALTTARYALVILNMMLPRGSSLDLLVWLRRINGVVPVFILAESDSPADCVRALAAGADDHLNKPFDARELVARCRALVRRSQGRSTNQIRHRELLIDTASRAVTRAGMPVTISGREWAILLQLIAYRGVPQSSSTLEDCIYGWKEEVESNAIQVHISNLRRKLGADKIETVRRVGYVIREE